MWVPPQQPASQACIFHDFRNTNSQVLGQVAPGRLQTKGQS